MPPSIDLIRAGGRSEHIAVFHPQRGVEWTVMRTALMMVMATLGLTAGGCLPKRDSKMPPPVSSRGELLFLNYCAACHQPDGSGMPGRIPPLAGSPWVTGSSDRIIRIVLHGLRGPIDVNGTTFEVEMLGFGPVLDDDDVSQILSHARSRFGTMESPVSAEQVARVRQQTQARLEYWTAAELLEVP